MKSVNWYLLSGVLFLAAGVINMLGEKSGAGALYLLAGVVMICVSYNYSKRRK